MDRIAKHPANYVPLTPLTFIKRAIKIYSNRTSVIDGGVQFTWSETYRRCCRLAYSLRSLNVVKNDVVSVLAPNVPALYEMHFAVPMAGAVLNPINTRLDAKTIVTILRHSEAKVFFVDYEYIPIASEALQMLVKGSEDSSSDHHQHQIPLVIVIDDINKPTSVQFGDLEYEQLIHQGDPEYLGEDLEDEWDAISLNYTSGTTSNPKGVVCSHRGAFLSTLSMIQGWELSNEAVYLWSLPMFHCNGWTFTWGVAARGGTNVCIRNVTASEMYKSISNHKVTHMCCAPIVLNILLEAQHYERCDMTSKVNILIGGSPPPVPVLEKMEDLGFHITHAYGLNEATGPALVCEWQSKWNLLPKDQQARLKARQGVSILTLSDIDVKNTKTMEGVPHDGKTMGEIVLRGSSLMKGYLKAENMTEKAFQNGWLLTGDVGVIHPDGYVEIKDRSKDVIISGGENISSVELESVLYKHPAILEAAVVAMPHTRWGESPCAFVVLKQTGDVNETEILAYCTKNMPKFMVPKKVEFVTKLPKTGTGKVLKEELRKVAKTLGLSTNTTTNSKVRAMSRL
ncbi:putative AMP-dependent synthetase/ligase, AMP-binding, AMP-binding enzyme domain-containing protein [Helianthus annuus]|uniref:AMP-dependent synthetase/ligase, AMP-binding enzyme domain-containing protein n=1 Tax=Helianthus annuus TaxID=4232 RepID=A0A251S843_HELAN|nr:butyrate--CoA ligase AAE11, peroxisomal [Helianthus annuus]KAF5762551.1 putative AMP-dependent synthetase/ligase, AMP-binding enzyme domain-containing protein [Helianthus annuus]KAJ0643039.1 putative AMP-dependent synthetase/ligase, AMP-binding, AMP-binding enzyme domain, ANL [Helianthus annuus]KAJ0823676.1 putative AMP-dependent synthetase/ligase, AMP-binding enzyme domain-containing protein [Helianthus annuus]KAJ0838407.1 putative AMP-dependent synthetase/ligase, AMP-binding, AMP-binding e